MENNERKLQTDQLFSEQFFLQYCTSDEESVSLKIGKHLDQDFLRACEKDGLIKPLHTEEQKRMTPEGERTEIGRLYSPFQIFLVLVLSKNIIDDEGFLRSTGLTTVDEQKERKARFMHWGISMSEFNVDSEKRRGTPPPLGVNHFLFAEDFHNFLMLLHTFDTIDPHKNRDFDNIRRHLGIPALQYDLSLFENDPATLLSQYSLNIEKLKILLRHIGLHTLHIDPLEKWYYYIRKHAQRRRDELKGLASVAQDLYGLCDILVQMIEIATEKKLPPFIDFIYPDFTPMGLKKTTYAGGIDLQAIKDVFSELEVWLAQPEAKEMIEKIKDSRYDGVQYEQIEQKINHIPTRIADFEERYGDRYYSGGVRYTSPEKKVTISMLDPAAQRHVEMMMKHHREDGFEIQSTGQREFATNDPELIDLWKKGKKDEAMRKHLEIQQAYEITDAIEYVLDTIQREIMEVCNWISRSLYPIRYKAEQQKTLGEPQALQKFMEGKDSTGEKYMELRAEFWQTGIKEAMKEYDDLLEKIKGAQNQMDDFIHRIRLVYCAHCRKRHVVLHQDHNDASILKGMICDECMENNPDLQAIKDGEWRCPFYNEKEGHTCDTLLYKFAHNNVLNTSLLHSSPAKISLDYGRMRVEISCPKCRKRSIQEVEWGWLS